MLNDYANYLREVHRYKEEIGQQYKAEDLLKTAETDLAGLRDWPKIKVKDFLHKVPEVPELYSTMKDYYSKLSTSLENNNCRKGKLLIYHFLEKIKVKINVVYFGPETGTQYDEIHVIPFKKNDGTVCKDGVTTVKDTDMANILVKEPPFEDGQRQIYWDENSLEMYNRMRDFIGTDKFRMLQVAGSPGTGKSTVAFCLAKDMSARCDVLWVTIRSKVNTWSILVMPFGESEDKKMYILENVKRDTAQNLLQGIRENIVMFFDSVREKNLPDVSAFGSSKVGRYIIASVGSKVTENKSAFNQIYTYVTKVTDKAGQSSLIVPDRNGKIKGGNEIACRFLWTLPKSKLIEALMYYGHFKLEASEVVSNLVSYKQFYSGVNFRWFLNQSVPRIVREINGSLAMASTFSKSEHLLTGAQSKESVNSLIYQLDGKSPTKNSIVSAFAEKRLVQCYSKNIVNSVDKIEYTKQIISKYPKMKGTIAENYIFDLFKHGLLAIVGMAAYGDKDWQKVTGEQLVQFEYLKDFEAYEFETSFARSKQEVIKMAQEERFVVHAYDKNPGWDYAVVDRKCCTFVQMTTSDSRATSLHALHEFLFTTLTNRRSTWTIDEIRFYFFCTHSEPISLRSTQDTPLISEYFVDKTNGKKWGRPKYGGNKRSGGEGSQGAQPQGGDGNQVDNIVFFRVLVPGINSKDKISYLPSPPKGSNINISALP